MSDPVEAVEGERERNSKLRKDLQKYRPGSKRSGQGCRVEVPPEERGDQVGGAEGVEPAREGHAGDTIGDGEDGGDLRLVD